MNNTPPDVVWTAREAFACALCWAEFSCPEERDDTPEQYWLSITPRARADCRHWANKFLLLAVARGHAVAILPPGEWLDSDRSLFGSKVGITTRRRIYQIVKAFWDTARMIRDAR